MQLTFNITDIHIAKAAINSICRAGASKEKTFKSNSIDSRLLAINRTILDKLKYVDDLLNRPDSNNDQAQIELNRVEIKVFIAGLLTTKTVQEGVLAEYEKRPTDHKSFSDAPGRRREDYIVNIKHRKQELETLLEKLKGSL